MIAPFAPLRKVPPGRFILHIAPGSELAEAYRNLPARIRKGQITYIRQRAGSPYLVVDTYLKKRVKFREAELVTDLIRTIADTPDSILMIEYSPAWFAHEPERVEEFVYLCRDRARNLGSVLLVATCRDAILNVIGDGVDKEIHVMNINPAGNETLPDTPVPGEERPTGNNPASYGQQLLSW